MEPRVVSVSQLFIDRNELSQLTRPSFDMVRNAAETIWGACEALKLPVQTYSAAMVYLHKSLVLNPDLLSKLELPTCDASDLRVVVAGCIITAYLTEGYAKKVDDVCRLLGVSTKSVLAMQRAVLETNCFDFRLQCVSNWVIKFAKALTDNDNNDSQLDNTFGQQYDPTLNNKKLSKDTIKLAWTIAIDVYETTAVIQFPAHNVAAACIEIAQRAAEKSLLAWEVQKYQLKIYAIRTSERLILEYYSRCARQKLSTHAPIDVVTNSDLMGWLASLQKGVRSVEPCPAPPVRDAEVSSKGTARYKIRGY